MKTCPNCGSKMEPSVNFCTNCGADLRNVPLDSEEHSVQASEPKMTRVGNRKETSEPKDSSNNNREGRATVNSRSVQSTQENTSSQQSNYQQPRPQSQVGRQFTQAVQNFDAHNMWQWFVNSWKHPFSDQQSERWYGWITLIVEDLLIGLGLFIGEQRAAGAADSMLGGTNIMNSSAGFTFGTAIEVAFFLALTEAAWILAAYLAYKVIYGKSRDFLDLTNHVVQTSNLSAIFIVVYFVFMLLMGPAGVAFSAVMLWLSILFFSMALTVVVLGHQNPVHDKFYGYVLFIALQFITGLILFLIIGGTVMDKLDPLFQGCND